MRGVNVKKGEPVDRALKRLKTKLDSEGILEEMRRRRAFETPTERKQRKLRTASKRNKVRWRFSTGAAPAEIETVANRLALAASMAINILNPTRLLIHSRVFLMSDARFDAVRAALDRLGLAASVADCRVERTQSSKEQAAVAGIIHEITQTWAPALR
jgi:small subunit ribosomal protein S21